MAKKFLLVSYYFPPASAAPVLRVYKLAKYAPLCGLQPFVLTARNSHCRAYDYRLWEEVRPLLAGSSRTLSVEIDLVWGVWRRLCGRVPPGQKPAAGGEQVLQSRLNRDANLLCSWLLSPDQFIGWGMTAIRAGIKAVRQHKLSFIYSNSYPYSAHYIAEAIHDRTGLPWFMDFRDGWILDEDVFRPNNRLYASLERRACARMLDKARAAFFMTPGLRERYAARFPEQAQKFHTVIQGIDPELRIPARVRPAGKMVFGYIGSLYPPVSSPQPLFDAWKEACRRLPQLKEHAELRFIGFLKGVAEAARASGIEESVRLLPQVPYGQALQEIADSDVLLLTFNDTAFNRLRLLTKTFDYLAARKPVLAAVPEESGVAELLRSCNCGVAVHPRETGRLAEAMIGFYEQWRRGSWDARPDEEQLRALDARTQIGRMCAVMNREAG